MPSRFRTFLKILTALFLLGSVVAGAVLFSVIQYYSKDLPEHSQLATYDPPTTTRLYAADGRLLAEYAKEKRLYVPIKAIPKHIKSAFIAAEDKNFYKHPGVDIISVTRAALQNLAVSLGKGGSLVGGSTITQQVVKNFLLTNERTLSRKIKEAILALRITKAFSKDRILELYLNEIYLGAGSYGVAAAALNYFNKSLDELSIEDAAMLASMPKAPSHLDPRRHYTRAKERRDWVIDRMEIENFISHVDAMQAKKQPIALKSRDKTESILAESFAGAAKKTLAEMLGINAVYERGLLVRTTLNPTYQTIAQNALQEGLEAYDRRHGYRGPIAHLTTLEQWKDDLAHAKRPAAAKEQWQLAIVLKTEKNKATIGLSDGKEGSIPLESFKWARPWKKGQYLGAVIKKPADVVEAGDIILVEPKENNKTQFNLRQIPDINGALVALDPHTGRVLAMVGGYAITENDFNRATQAKRQPGSAFKPFVYLAAFESGFTPASIIVDAPIELEQGPGLPLWKPQNYNGKFNGPTTLRRGLELSKNAMTVRLGLMIGIEKILEVAKRFGINKNPARNLSTVLGATETTLLDIVSAYGILINGGKRITPSLIDRIQDRNGLTIYRHDKRACSGCLLHGEESIPSLLPPELPDIRETVTDPVSAYQITSVLHGVVQRGTGRRARAVKKTLGGKTGTTNKSVDSWFIGGSPDLVVGVYTGFDNPKTLGRHETGASVALPIFTEFFQKALKDTPDIPFRIPSGAKLVKIDALTGMLPSSETKPFHIIYEAFKTGTKIPRGEADNRMISDQLPSSTNHYTGGTGGVY